MVGDIQMFHTTIVQQNQASKQSTEEIKKSSAGLSGLQKSALAAGAAITGIVASSGGSAWETFKGSLQMVGMQLARFFIPALMDASEMAQDFAHWLETGLSPETRKTIERFASLAAGVAGLYLAVNFLTNPMVLLTAAVIAAVLAFKMIPEIIEWIGEQWRHLRSGAEGEKGKAKAALAGGLGGSFLLDYIFGTEPIKGLDKGQSFKDMFIKNLEKSLGELSDDMQKAIGKVAGVASELFGGGKGEGEEEKSKKRQERRRMAFAFPTEMQPRFMAVEEARKQFQLGALKSPLEQELMRMQREMAQQVVQEAGSRNTMYDAFKAGVKARGLG
jgi:hypothetical protein